ncbi:MAG: hypothetical protein GF311_05430 [Candidatus Lokiarchaeota archaeon]|nr:hypothetical protein [Candidatus Lokiarchaeota archaeon]
MKKLSLLREWKKKIGQKFKNYEFIKRTSKYAIHIYVSFLIIACFFAIYFGKEAFLVFNNLISHLGFYEYTPFPFIFNWACILSGILFIPFFLNLFLRLKHNLKEGSLSMKHDRFFRNFSSAALYSGILGSVGLIGQGIFNMSWGDIFMHMIFSTLAFGGFVFLGFFMGLLIVIYDLKISINLGLYGVISTLLLLAFWFNHTSLEFVGFVFLEWIWMCISLSWMWLFIRSVFKDSANSLGNILNEIKNKYIRLRFEFKEGQ